MDNKTNSHDIKVEKKENGFDIGLNRGSIIKIILFVIIIYFAVLLFSKYKDIAEYTAEKEKLILELKEKETEIKRLEEMIKNAQDPKFIEKMARENLKMVKPDETVYMVVK